MSETSEQSESPKPSEEPSGLNEIFAKLTKALNDPALLAQMKAFWEEELKNKKQETWRDRPPML